MFNPLNFFRKFPIDVVIHEKRANGLFIQRDKARRETKHQETRYVLKNRNTKIKAADFKNVMINARGKSILYLFSPKSDQYLPMKIEHKSDSSIKVINEDTRHWFLSTLRKNEFMYSKKSFIQTIMPVIMVVATGIAIAIILYSSVGQMANVAGALGSVADKLDHVAATLQPIVHQVPQGPVPIPPG